MQNWMQRRYHTLSSAFFTKPGLLPSLFLFLPSTCLPDSYCFGTRLAVRLQCVFLTFARHPSTRRGQSLLFYLFFSSLFLPPRPNCSSCCRQCRRRSPRRISSSELARRILTVTKPSSMALPSRNTLNPRLRKTTRGHWASEMGRFTAVAPHQGCRG